MPEPRSNSPEALREYIREHRPLCPFCAYSLSGLDQPICPECGKEITVDLLESTRDEILLAHDPLARVLAPVMLALMMLGLVTSMLALVVCFGLVASLFTRRESLGIVAATLPAAVAIGVSPLLVVWLMWRWLDRRRKVRQRQAMPSRIPPHA